MSSQTLRLPDGQTFSVTRVFAGVYFKSHELNVQHHNAFPIGWTVVIRTEEEVTQPFESENNDDDENDKDGGDDDAAVMMDDDGKGGGRAKTSSSAMRNKRIKAFVQPSLDSDYLFISSISHPSNVEFKPAASPTRHIALMLWITLYWYFHQAKPPAHLTTPASSRTPTRAKPTGEWKVWIRRDGMLRGRNRLPKLERMGLVASADTATGTTMDDSGEGWARMFVSQHMFWQIPAQLFLFTLQPNRSSSPFPGSPAGSRPSSPVRGESPHYRPPSSPLRLEGVVGGAGLLPSPSMPPWPFHSASHLPTYFPPPPLQYVFTDGVRHPLRPKPHRMGEIFYCRFVPSVGQYLSFRVASSSPKPVPYLGPVPTISPPGLAENAHLATLSDAGLLQLWMSKPRVSEFWGEYTPTFLTDILASKHGFPVIGMWDGIPFGYFEIYWVKEDVLGRHVGDAGDWDRGFHVFIGEEWARGRVAVWLSSIVHWCLMADSRTMSVCSEPRVDNARLLRHLDEMGFSRQRRVSFPHKRSWYMRFSRSSWEGPAL